MPSHVISIAPLMAQTSHFASVLLIRYADTHHFPNFQCNLPTKDHDFSKQTVPAVPSVSKVQSLVSWCLFRSCHSCVLHHHRFLVDVLRVALESMVQFDHFAVGWLAQRENIYNLSRLWTQFIHAQHCVELLDWNRCGHLCCHSFYLEF